MRLRLRKDMQVITHLLTADCPSVCLSRVDLETESQFGDWKSTTERLSAHISCLLHQNSTHVFFIFWMVRQFSHFPPLCFRKELKGIHLPDPCYLCLAWVRRREEGWTSAWMQLLAQQKQATVHQKPAGGWGGRLGGGARGNTVSEWDVWHEAEFSDLATAARWLWSWESEKKRGVERMEAEVCERGK